MEEPYHQFYPTRIIATFVKKDNSKVTSEWDVGVESDGKLSFEVFREELDSKTSLLYLFYFTREETTPCPSGTEGLLILEREIPWTECVQAKLHHTP
jgi:hypothetical protein